MCLGTSWYIQPLSLSGASESPRHHSPPPSPVPSLLPPPSHPILPLNPPPPNDPKKNTHPHTPLQHRTAAPSKNQPKKNLCHLWLFTRRKPTCPLSLTTDIGTSYLGSQHILRSHEDSAPCQDPEVALSILAQATQPSDLQIPP